MFGEGWMTITQYVNEIQFHRQVVTYDKPNMKAF
jgi:hypothetical protein